MKSNGTMGSVGVVVYCRVSTQEQTQNLSLQTQEKACRDFCLDRGWRVVQVFVEQGESAKTANRPELLRMLELCRRNQTDIDHVVVYRLDRFARQQYDHVVIAQHLARLGITVKSATEPIDDTPTGQLLGNVISAFAQFDSDVREERTIAGMQEALREGRWPFRAPLGYERGIDAAGRHTIAPHPEQGPLVRRAFDVMATGRYPQREACDKLTTEGLRRSGRRPLDAEAFRRMLRNPLYKGEMNAPEWRMSGLRGRFEPIRADPDLRCRTGDPRRALGAVRGAPARQPGLPAPSVRLVRGVRQPVHGQPLARAEPALRLLLVSGQPVQATVSQNGLRGRVPGAAAGPQSPARVR